jgi:predicted nucleic acid-binding protein
MTFRLIDSDVVIDYLRGYPAAVAFIDSLADKPATSAIVVAELYAGVRDGPDRRRLERLLAATRILPLTAEIAVRGGLYRRQFGKSHNVGLADALIAATAHLEGATLVTLNQKHFPMLSNVQVPYSKP